MGKDGFLQRGVGSLLGAGALAFAAAVASGAEPVADKEKVLEKARASYYSLQKAGLTRLTCTITPNWEMMLRDIRKNDPKEAARRLKIYQKIRFEITAPIDGDASVTHSYSGDEDPELTANLDSVYGGIEEGVSGFYSTWSGFVVTPFLPDPTEDYVLEQDHGDYRISSHDGGMDISAILGKDMAIKKARVITKEVDSTVLPTFKKVDGLYLLSGFDATYQSGAEKPVALHVLVDYQVVAGIQVPRKVNMTAGRRDQPFEVEVTFSDCRVAKN